MLADVRTFDRLSVAKEMSVWQAVKRMGRLWQQCMVLHFTHRLGVYAAPICHCVENVRPKILRLKFSGLGRDKQAFKMAYRGSTF